MTFDDQSKQTNLYLSGWMNDTPTYVTDDDVWTLDPMKTNEGQKARNNWFREGCRDDSSKAYSKEGMIFCTVFKHEFAGIQTVFPPATKIQFTLSKIKRHKHWDSYIKNLSTKYSSQVRLKQVKLSGTDF